MSYEEGLQAGKYAEDAQGSYDVPQSGSLAASMSGRYSEQPGSPAKTTDLADDVHAYLVRFVAFPSPQAAVAVTLWAVHSHALQAAESTPRLAVLSVEKGSGKTRVLEVLETIVPTPRHAVNMTAAALFRAVAADQPTLLFDEADTYFGPHAAREHEELRGLVNAGHRRGAVAYRVVGRGTEMEVKAFRAFAAVAVAGIGDLPDTILDRSIVIRMRRRAPDEHVEPFRSRRARPVGEALRDRLATWASDHIAQLVDADPEMPPGLVDRAADVWEPLIAIADELEGDWPVRARTAALSLNAERQAADTSLGIRLLADVRTIYADVGAEKVSTENLVKGLVSIVEAPWGDLRGRALDPRSLARRLKPYGITPKKVRIGQHAVQGYDSSDFADAWRRYLPDPKIPEQTEHPEQRSAGPAVEHPEPRSRTCDVPEVPLLAGERQGHSTLLRSVESD
jgi:hypothetical protein